MELSKNKRLSVNIITFNEGHKLKECLESVKWAKEIIIIDSFSTDNTKEVCSHYKNVKVFDYPFLGYGRLRNIAIEKSTGEWILSLDTDERVTEELKKEILQVLTDNPPYDAFRIPRRSYFLGRWIKHCGWYPDYRSMQLFRKGVGEYTDYLAHDHFYLFKSGRVGTLRGHIEHITCLNLEEAFIKTQRYSSLMAQEMHKRGRRFHIHQLISHPFAAFIRMYLFKLGFLDGIHGLILSTNHAYYTFLKYAKLWRIEKSAGSGH